MNRRIKYSINSFSYYKSLCVNGFDIYSYIVESYNNQCSELNPWFGHFTEIDMSKDDLSDTEKKYLLNVLDFARSKGLSFNLVTVDGNTYIYDNDPAVRKANLKQAQKWIEISGLLNANGVRFDASLPEEQTELTDDVLSIIVDGYQKLIDYGKKIGIKIYIENHYGVTSLPDNVLKILNQLPDLGYLFDSWNWHHKKVAEGWIKCISKASEVHIKTFYFCNNEDILINLPSLFRMLDQVNFKGCYTFETMPLDLEHERTLISDTINFIKSIKEKENE